MKTDDPGVGKEKEDEDCKNDRCGFDLWSLDEWR